MKIDLSKYDLKQKWSFFFIILYLSLLVSFYLGENTTGGAFVDFGWKRSEISDLALKTK